MVVVRCQDGLEGSWDDPSGGCGEATSHSIAIAEHTKAAAPRLVPRRADNPNLQNESQQLESAKLSAVSTSFSCLSLRRSAKLLALRRGDVNLPAEFRH